MERPINWLVAALVVALVTAFATAPALAASTEMWAVGDGGSNLNDNDVGLGDMIEAAGSFDRFLYLGDVYETGTAEEFAQNYEPAFGRFKAKTSPTVGNHEWANRATGYDAYFGANAPQNGGGHWYSFDVPGWHIVSLSSEESLAPDFIQTQWLREDLARNEGTCTLAFFHKPRYSAQTWDPVAAPNNDREYMEGAWRELEGRASVILNGHDHDYQRFKPTRGITQFIVGTGGHSWYPVNESDGRLDAYLDARGGETAAALNFELNDDGTMAYRLVAADGSVRDFGTLTCSQAAPRSTAAPAVTGTARAGETLTAGDGSWTGTPLITFTREWLRCDAGTCTPIEGATGATYAPTGADVGRRLKVRVTATNPAGSTSVSSAETAVMEGAPQNDSPPVVSGSAVEASTLTATSGSWRGVPAPSLSYAWERCDGDGASCTTISGATAAGYTAAPDDVGSTLRARVTAENGHGSTSARSAPTAPIAARPPVSSGAPSISGTARQGSTLTAGDGSWNGTAPFRFSYQWLRCSSSGTACAAIQDATAKTYGLTAADAGLTVRVRVTAANAAGSASAESAAAGPVTAAPAATSAPAVSGTARDGSVLTASDGAWSGVPAPDIGRQWLRCAADGTACTATSATGPQYTLAPADVGHAIRVRVTAVNSAGSASVDSEPTAAVAARPPTASTPPSVTGTARDGETLTSSTGAWDGTPTISYAREWRRCNAEGAACSPIAGAAGATYVLGAADVGHTIRVAVTASNAGGSSTTASGATGLVAAAPPAAATGPSIAGTARDGDTLTASDGSWTGTAPVVLTRAWQRCAADATGCAPTGIASADYPVTTADVGSRLRVVVSASNAGGSAQAASEPTAVVVAAGEEPPPPPPPPPAEPEPEPDPGPAPSGPAPGDPAPATEEEPAPAPVPAALTPVSPAEPAPPVIRMATPRLRTFAARGVVVRVGCAAACSVRAALLAGPAAARSLGLALPRGGLALLARGSGAARPSVRLRLPSAVSPRVRRLARLRLTVEVTVAYAGGPAKRFRHALRLAR